MWLLVSLKAWEVGVVKNNKHHVWMVRSDLIGQAIAQEEPPVSSIRLLLENQPRSAYLMALEGNVDLDAVGYLDEWDPAVHAKFLAVKRHAALNIAVARSLFLGVKC